MAAGLHPSGSGEDIVAYQDSSPALDRDAGGTVAASEQAVAVAGTAAGGAGDVARTARDQARDVAGEATRQTRDLAGEARMQVREQAGVQKDRTVQGLLILGEELEGMAARSRRHGVGADTARRLSERALALAQHIDLHEPADLLAQAQSYARRRPVGFLACAAVAGVLAGRLTRGLAAPAADQDADPASVGAPHRYES